MKKKSILIISVLVLLMAIGLSYAFFVSENSEDNNNSTFQTTKIKVYYDNSDGILRLNNPSNEAYQKIFKFRVQNLVEEQTPISIKFNLVKSTLKSSLTSYTLYYCNATNYLSNNITTITTNCTSIASTNNKLPGTGDNIKMYDPTYLNMVASTTNNYILIASINTNGGTTFESYIDVTEYDEPNMKEKITIDNTAYEDNITSTNVSEGTGIAFGTISSNTNGQGLYYTDSEDYIEKNNRIYYYRGAVTNNNLIFANMCWKIIRTTEVGGIKLIYNGLPINGTCVNTTEVGTITTTSAFVTGTVTDNAYLGYKSGTSGQITYGATHTNRVNSTLKTYLEDTWFVDKLTEYESGLEDNGYCNDRSIDSRQITNNLGYGTNQTMYAPYTRVNTYKRPSYKCTNILDKYTTSNTRGNGQLEHKIGLITADEIMYAGGTSTANTTFYLYNNKTYWTMSPYSYASEPNFYILTESGILTYAAGTTTTAGIRPVITLNNYLRWQSGDGTTLTPYKVNYCEVNLPDQEYTCPVDWTLETEGTHINSCSQLATCTVGTLTGNYCYTDATHTVQYCCGSSCTSYYHTCSSSSNYTATYHPESCDSGSPYQCTGYRCCAKSSTCASGTKTLVNGSYKCKITNTRNFSTMVACNNTCTGTCAYVSSSLFRCTWYTYTTPSCSGWTLNGNQNYCLSSSPYNAPYYSCDSGGTLTGTSTCTIETTVPPREQDDYNCASGWNKSGTQCYRSPTCENGGTLDVTRCYTNATFIDNCAS